jgi:hypothetical protein
VNLQDRQDVVRIVQAEGLFTMGVEAATRLHTSYRWVHRTVQEHLVAMYLEESYGDDPTTLVDRLLRRVRGSKDWRVVTQHVFERMSPGGQLSLLDRLEEAEGDPVHIWGEPSLLRQELLATVQEDTPIYERLVDRLVGDGVWWAKFHRDPESTRLALLIAAQSNVPIGSIGLELPEVSPHIDSAYLHTLIKLLKTHSAEHHELLREACLLLESLEPHAGAREYFDVISDVGVELPSRQWPKSATARLNSRFIAALISEYPVQSARWKLLFFAAESLDIDYISLAAPNGPLDPREVDIVQIVRREMLGPMHRLGGALRDAVAGEYGDVVAYLSARGLAADAVRNVVQHPWGVVGAWEYALLHSADVSNATLMPKEHLSPVDIVRTYDQGWRADPEQMRRLYWAISESIGKRELIGASDLVELYRRVICDTDRTSFHFAHMRIDASSIEEVLEVAFRVRGLDDIATTILAYQPSLWVDARGRLPLLEKYLADRYKRRQPSWAEAEYRKHFSETADLFYAVTTWGAGAGMATMTLFPRHVVESPEVRDRVLGRLDKAVLGLPDNLAWLDSTMGLFWPGFWQENRSECLASVLRVTNG